METRVINEITDLRYLNWSHVRSSSGTAGSFLKSESKLNSKKIYYKLSNFDSVRGIVGHECVNEIIVDRLLTVLGVDHLHYSLINALIEIDGKEYNSYICASEDYKQRGESKLPLDNYYIANRLAGESPYEFCIRNGWRDYIETMIATDFIILNRDRHGANIEVLRNARRKTLRIAPLFDHGCSLLFSCATDEEALNFDIFEDKKCQNYIGTYSCRENLDLIRDKKSVFKGKLQQSDRDYIFQDLNNALSETFRDRIWDMIYERYKMYENL